jgi:hypothetical protein
LPGTRGTGPHADASKIAGRGKTVVYQRWFRERGGDENLPDDTDRRGEFVKAAALELKTIATLDQAAAFETSQDAPVSHPVGFKVTVTNIPAVAGMLRPAPP